LAPCVELKRHLNKPDQVYPCQRVFLEPDHLILRYVSGRSGRVGHVLLEPGSTTYAHYWTRRGVVGWRMLDPSGRLKGHLFHICRDVRIEPGMVDYLDLLLDIWVDPEGRATVLDGDEVEECLDLGSLLPKDHRWIGWWKGRVLREREALIREMDQTRGKHRASNRRKG
jgi:hypothetical protein